MNLRLAGIALLPLLLAACDEQALKDIRMPWDKPLDAAPAAEAAAAAVPLEQQPLAAPAVAPTQVPIEIEGERKAVATAESQTLNTTAFTARGNEPFWRVDVADGTARYQTPENQSGRSIPVQRLVYARGVEYVGVLDGQPFTLNIRSAACTDTMSGEKFPMTAALRARGRVATGCAGPQAAAATGASASAAASAAPAGPAG